MRMVAKIPQDEFTNRRVCVLTIAGSDSSGASGIQADLKTFAAFRTHGLSVVTAVTAQNTRAIAAIHRVPTAHIHAQLRAVIADFPIRAVKIGMLGSASAIDAVADVLSESSVGPIVLDPVLVSTSGTRLLPSAALKRLRERLLPLVDVLTPNVPEAEALLDRSISSLHDHRGAALELLSLRVNAALLKGGHATGTTVRDYFAQKADIRKRDQDATLHTFAHRRFPIDARGTGCTLASAIAASLALGATRLEAVQRAEQYLQRCFRKAYQPSRSERFVLDH